MAFDATLLDTNTKIIPPQQASAQLAFESMFLLFDGKADAILNNLLSKNAQLSPEEFLQNEERLVVWFDCFS